MESSLTAVLFYLLGAALSFILAPIWLQNLDRRTPTKFFGLLILTFSSWIGVFSVLFATARNFSTKK